MRAQRLNAGLRGPAVVAALVAVIGGGLLLWRLDTPAQTGPHAPAWPAIEWTSPADGSPQLVRATWLGGWVGINWDGVWRSKDGRTWRKLGPADGLKMGTPNDLGFGRLAAGVVVSGQDGSVWYSQDGDHWEPAQMSAELADWGMLGLDCGEAGCIGTAIEHGADTDTRLVHSKDGRSWEMRDPGYLGLSAVVIGPRAFVQGGDDPNTQLASASWSEDGSTWTEASYDGSRVRRGSFARGFVTSDGFALVEVAPDKEDCYSGCVEVPIAMWTSTDGHRWTRAASQPPNGDFVSDGSHVVASRVINTPSTYRVELTQSFDGATWEPLASAFPEAPRDLRLLALGPDSLLVTDTSGTVALKVVPTPAATPALTLAPAPTARGDLVETTVAVKSCPIAGWPPAEVAVSATMTVRVPPSLVGKLEVRSHPSGRAFVLSPIGSDCSGSPSGSSVWVMAASFGGDWIHFEFVTQGDYAADVACLVFPQARDYASSHCNPAEASEVRWITPELATYWRQDAAGRDREAVWYRHSGYGRDMAALLICHVTSTSTDMCDAAVEFFADTVRLLPGFNP